MIEVKPLDSGDVENLRLLGRPELGPTYSKLYAWRLTQYSKCVFLDADTLVCLHPVAPPPPLRHFSALWNTAACTEPT